MGLLDILSGPVKGLVGAVGSIIDDLHTSDEEKAEAKAKLVALTTAAEAQILQHGEELFKAQRDVLVAEVKGESVLQRNWRPVTMLVFVFIIANNYVIAPYVAAFGGNVPTLDIPNGMWALLNVGIGGYIASRGLEKVTKARNGSR